MTKIRLEGVVDPHLEDSGQAEIAEISGAEDSGLFVRLQSWSENKSHPIMDSLRGQRVAVTVEVISTEGAQRTVMEDRAEAVRATQWVVFKRMKDEVRGVFAPLAEEADRAGDAKVSATIATGIARFDAAMDELMKEIYQK